MSIPPISEGKSRLMLVEGPDDVLFFAKLTEHLERSSPESFDFTKFETLPFGGAQQLVSSLELLARDPRYDQVSHIGIVRDSDYNTDAFASVCNAIARFNSQPPTSHLPLPTEVFTPTQEQPHVSILTMPLKADGTLESVVLSALDDDEIVPCVNGYFNCIEEVDPNADFSQSRLPKSKLAVLIAGKSTDRNKANVPDVKRRLLHNVYGMTWLPVDFWEREPFDDAKAFLHQLLAD